MAILRKQKALTTPTLVFETVGKIYLEGQAHDAATLAGRSNDLVVGGNVPTQTKAMSPMGAALWGVVGAATVSQYMGISVFDSTLFDNGLGVCRINYYPVNSPGLLFVNSNPDGYSLNVQSIFNTADGRLERTAAPGTGGGRTSSVAFFDSAAQGVFVLISSARANAPAQPVAIQRYSPLSPSATRTTALETLTSLTAFPTLQLIHESENFFLFRGLIADVPGAASTMTMYAMEKATGTVTARGTYSPPSTTSGPGYFGTCGINTSGTIVKSYTATFGAAGGASAVGPGMWSFIVSTTDTATPTVNSTFAQVTPALDSAIPGRTANAVGLQVRTWHRIEGNTVYLFVTQYEPSTNALLDPTRQFIWTYKTTLSSPDIIEFVTATQVNVSSIMRGCMPTNNRFDALLIPYNNQVEYWTWSPALQTYVKQNSINVTPASMMVDQLGRYWISDARTNDLHINSPQISSDVTVTFQNPSLTYTGTPISTNLVVNSYNTLGQRIASSVTIQLDTASAAFTTGGTSITVTTSANGDQLVPVTVTGAGYIRVLASLTV